MHIPTHDIEFEHDHILILEFILLITCGHIKSSKQQANTDFINSNYNANVIHRGNMIKIVSFPGSWEPGR